ncbi:MAG TPA: ATP-dependent metallopeptidase FtsH/Yme1/Tma family protein, partial [Acidimicrobiales bacterium]|nr:ATP-dependent metallopeptidase FtsH/Yme1/Tma family protein [Acidimicrobiales bacterium]
MRSRLPKVFRSAPFWVAVALVAVLVAGGVFRSDGDRKKLRLDEFESKVASGQVKDATITDRDAAIQGELVNGDKYRVNYVRDDAEKVVDVLRSAGVHTKVDHQKDPIWWTIVQTFLPFVLLVGAFLFVMNTMQ